MGLKSPIFIGAKYDWNNNKLAATPKPGLESFFYDPKTYPAFAAISSVRPRMAGALVSRSFWSRCWPFITAGCCNFYPTSPTIGHDAVKGSDKPIASGRCGECKGVITRQEMKRMLIITVVLICISGLALVAVACHTLTDFVGFPDFGRAVDYRRHHLHRG